MTRHANITRVTSLYTLTIEDGPSRYLTTLRPSLPPIQDQGEASLSWRSADDSTAKQEALTALRAAQVEPGVKMVLTTGLGVHRRVVAEAFRSLLK